MSTFQGIPLRLDALANGTGKGVVSPCFFMDRKIARFLRAAIWRAWSWDSRRGRFRKRRPQTRRRRVRW